ncbi:ABC transporter ATP-binding protein [Paraburkholderia adhaesiva]|uniref:ABC transporter ATP-binding protein n=1 Tax=Paraburkholderia adhaesiva TaxID=2883244 RepID=UPI001F218A22|nr:sn-glycerol-3-phosphate ABC transporter ATP-binding protein UgpC [Paraburkholderia adhaesiva]
MAQLSLLDIRKSFGDHDVIHGVDLDVADGEFVVFVGPSGCGKSTMLRMIAGLEEVSGGTIRIDGRDVTGVSPSQREIAMVFQSYALFPHMTVAENIGFGLRISGASKRDIKRRVGEVATTLQLDRLLERFPRELSGGQRQRVAIGRAIIRNPKVFLFDEPLSNLDAALRVQMRLEIARLHADLRATMVYVTHDQVEAMTLADRIVVFNGGKVEQVGTPMELYERPANLFVARFIGAPAMNVLPDSVWTWLSASGSDSSRAAPEGLASVGIRPENIALCERADEHLAGRIELIERLGAETLYYVRIGEGLPSITVRSAIAHDVRRGDEVGLSVDTSKLHCFDNAGQRIEDQVDRTGSNNALNTESLQTEGEK